MAKRNATPVELMDAVADSWCRRNRPESMNTDWGQSLLAYGLLETVRTTGNANAREYLRRWLTYHLGAGVHVTYFVGSWSIGLLYPHVIDLFPEFGEPLRALAGEIDAFIRMKAIRNGRGTILHNVDLPHIYVDTVYYSAPILAKLAATLNRRDWQRDAIFQLREHLAVLRDPATGFSIHCQENRSGHRSEGAWGRGNGWIAMTCAELLPYLRPRSEEWRVVATTLDTLMAALLPHQTSRGLWRTIIADRKAYEETSATAMYLFAMERAIANGWLPKGFGESADRATRGLARFVDADGRFTGCSEGTWPGTAAYYKSLDRGEWWWGTGALLLALAERARRIDA
ncbi:MAG: glycoside hydrolase family 88 protein [Bacteroidetes bacterium]|nr:glycoside hydrolase family 88 protein [Bacteroidota bacterium]